MKNMRPTEYSNLKASSEFKYSNRLIEAKYKLSLTQQRIILTLASMVKPEDDKMQEYEIKIREFAKTYEIKGEGILALFKESTKDLLSRPVILDSEKSTIQFNWISSAVYANQESSVVVRFDPILRPYLLEIKDKFTLFLLNCFSGLKSYYSIRIYMLLKQYTKIGSRKFDIEELRDTLGIKKDEYKLYSDFKSRALEKAKKEINDHTDIEIEYKETKTGKKITDVVFYIKEKNSIVEVKKDDGEDKKNKGDKSDPERTLENAKNYFIEKKYKSDPEKFFSNQESKKWRGVVNWRAKADEWELNYKSMKPELYSNVGKGEEKKLTEEELEKIKEKNKKNEQAQKVFREIRFILGSENFDNLQYFSNIEIENGIVKVTDQRAMKYKDLLADNNIKIEMK